MPGLRLGPLAAVVAASRRTTPGRCRRRFTDLGGTVEWSSRLVDARRDGDGVLATVRTGRRERVLTEFSRRSGTDLATVERVCWASEFRIHRRLAEAYRRGRMLLAGDAAHIQSPTGGQGQNTGLGDAENLARSARRWRTAPRPGDRVPDVACRRLDGTDTTLHRAIGGRWVVLAADPHDARRYAVAAAELLGTDLVTPLSGPPSGDVLLVRPDGHLAWRGRDVPEKTTRPSWTPRSAC